MFREIRCCTPSCEASAVVADGLVSERHPERTDSHAAELAAQLGWISCHEASHSAGCYRCPEHHA